MSDALYEVTDYKFMSRYYEYRDGELICRTNQGSLRAGEPATGRMVGARHTKTGLKYKRDSMAYIIWLLHYTVWPTGEIWFRDNDPTNMRIENLMDEKKIRKLSDASAKRVR